MINENEFFRDASLLIFGNLRIERGLHEILLYLRGKIPADHIFLNFYETGLGAYRTIATASVDGGQEVDVLTPMPPEIQGRIRKRAFEYSEGRVVIDSEGTNPAAAEMVRFHGIEGSSILRMTLMTDDGRLSSIVLTADGENRYTEEHTHWFGMLFQPFSIALSTTLHHREVLSLRDQLSDDNRFLHRELLRHSGDEIVGADFGLRDVMLQVRQVSPTESPILLTGETGVGKDLIASAIHLGSPRREGPFIPVNCGAIPPSLLDSELFGHERGAFTGALSRKRGRFERANGGTILLDEIGEMPLDAQVRLLRVLQHREVERVGGTDRIPVDIRVIAATNKDLAEMVRTGRFREDLWFRLNVFPIVVPPLRDRRSDLPALVQHFLDRKAKELKIGNVPRLAPGAMEQLAAYAWRGNVRELENLVERAMIVHRGEPLSFEGLGVSPPNSGKEEVGAPDQRPTELDAMMAAHIRRVLDMAGGKIHGSGGAGELLGVNPNTLRYRMKKLGIPFRKDTMSG
jgi:transcriptional regulator with GAF, ATPase, and Fis domain